MRGGADIDNLSSARRRRYDATCAVFADAALSTSAREGLAIVDQAIADVAAGKVSDAEVASFMMW
ncbi:MAG: hypothetical protein EOR84_21250 [Mesorhizobium sp.]|uniref:hypothetical protein n=1 Tax=Mesorhizobium sp. TaxID=1871066 RepID=UPI000FE4B49C|nr:hypothetical protein [Mesorhizobium sp.]RWM91028.1 MAG: hypothetical protein EOR84_21250 [Mesorhizobium sp.]